MTNSPSPWILQSLLEWIDRLKRYYTYLLFSHFNLYDPVVMEATVIKQHLLHSYMVLNNWGQHNNNV